MTSIFHSLEIAFRQRHPTNHALNSLTEEIRNKNRKKES